MSEQLLSSDSEVLDLLRQNQSMTVNDLAAALEVTPTAVRQRLTRLLAQNYIARIATKVGRGRPSHHYSLTPQGRRTGGSNFADLAMALWDEIRQIAAPEIRRGLLERVSRRLATSYAAEIEGNTLTERMESVSSLFRQREIAFTVDRSGDLPILKALACPYPELAERDRSICAMESILFSELLGEKLKLTQCRLDGDACCTFEGKEPAAEELSDSLIGG
ncbi:helix-turn-helix transcriptional regulator [Lignipirellula cremea]|uniref:MarR family protein n=1 Tax=Lignipirellula cremea TaxID=2528010 RepID=A0A518E030_9BACT|nr:winged helix-turn-helix transcriptional regulator [Lignipirellula cremea]QDU97446.1 MarR family protein [Lignipirellula cremea]